MKKKLTMLMAAVIASTVISVPVMADNTTEQGINIVVSGAALECDQPPVIVEGRTLIPLRAVAEAVGAEVNWNGDKKAVEINKDGLAVSLEIGSPQVSLGSQTVAIDVPAQIINDRTMVPIRFVAEAFGLEVEWDGDTKTVVIGGEAVSSVNEETTVEETTVEETSTEESSEVVTEEATEQTTSAVKVHSSKDSDYSLKETGKETVSDSIVIDDVTIYTASATYDTIKGNDAYNEFVKNLAEESVAKNIAVTGANRKSAFDMLEEDERDDFELYKTETNIEAVYCNNVVVSTKITTKFYKESLIYNTEVSTMLTDPTGANTVNVADITGGVFTDDDVYKIGLEKFNALFDSDKIGLYLNRVKNGGLTQDMLNIYIDINGNFVVYAKRGIVADSGQGEVAVIVNLSELEKNRVVEYK